MNNAFLLRPLRLFAAALVCLCLVQSTLAAPAGAEPRPNILWITSEDNGPHLGCYGDEFADTPNIDRLAQRGTLYLNAWSTAPVCAPARTTIISGIYPPATGAEHMRSMTRLPEGMLMYPQYLRRAGYYCTNNSKEDYNLAKPGVVWDESSRKGHWRNRKPGQPFFAVFNFTTSHESQIRRRPHNPVHDPAKVRVPDYHPDTPEVRQDWAQYYDKVTEMDAQVGRILAELEKDGLADDTIVFYYGDHGSGMPRSKRWPYNSGLRVPMIVHLPEKFRHLAADDYEAGGRSDRLVGFIDLAPTVLSLAGIEPPDHMQGHAFQGPFTAPEQPFAFGFRGRMDERYDLVRVARDKRYIYLRHYMPHMIYGQHVAYMFQTPTTRVWRQLFDRGELSAVQARFWQIKPAEELYDLQEDPDEVRDLVDSPDHREVLARLRKAHHDWVLRVRDVGFLPEAEIHSRSGDTTPYELGHDPDRYPLERILAAAQAASSLSDAALPGLTAAMERDADSAVRYWGAMGILMRGATAVEKTREKLHAALADKSPSVRVVAAEALCRYGNDDDLNEALPVLIDSANLQRSEPFVVLAAMNAIDVLDDKTAGSVDEIRALPRTAPSVHSRAKNYAVRLLDKILSDLQEK